jgi:hypothetical protein
MNIKREKPTYCLRNFMVLQTFPWECFISLYLKEIPSLYPSLDGRGLRGG